jgi:hypothetical protein
MTDALPSWNHSESSRRAAGDAAPRAESQKVRIWRWLIDHPQGAIYEKVARELDLPIQSGSTRITQMRDDGMIAHKIGADGKPVMAKTTEDSYANVYVALPKPWTPVPRRPRGKKFDALYAAATAVIEAVDSKDGDALRASIRGLRSTLKSVSA